MVNIDFCWPSGDRDTTEAPKVEMEIDVELRDHLKAFCNMDGKPWTDFEEQGKAGGLEVQPSRLRTYRKMYERLGLIYKNGCDIRLSSLGLKMRDLESSLRSYERGMISNITEAAVDILARYQLKNPVDGKGLPDDCDVQPYLCIWQVMRALDNKINNEEMNRVVLHIEKMSQVENAINVIKDARKKYGNYQDASDAELVAALGCQVHSDSKQIGARIAPWFSCAGWGGLIIETHQADDGYRHLVPQALPAVDCALNNPPHFFETTDKEAWRKYYIGNATVIDANSLTAKVVGEPNNLIYCGAPGTGKSYELNRRAESIFKKENITRVTAYPDYTYSQFVGCFKPMTETDVNEKGEKTSSITYRYTLGPFLETYVEAIKNPKQEYLLIVEEINRANPAAVFGDVFQLLDRRVDGCSEYTVAASEDMRIRLAAAFGTGVDGVRRLSLPGNMYIWATMNSADQGVFPMDTAFKRRWDFRYMGIDEGETADIDGTPLNKIKVMCGGRAILWNNLRHAINEFMASEQVKVNEDKLLGPFFINPRVLVHTPERFSDVFKDKVLLYLYEDAGKTKRTKLFRKDLNTYSKICEEFDRNGVDIFADGFDDHIVFGDSDDADVASAEE